MINDDEIVILLTDQEATEISHDFADLFIDIHSKYHKVYKVINEMKQRGLLGELEYRDWFKFITGIAYRRAQDSFYIRIPLKFKLKQD